MLYLTFILYVRIFQHNKYIFKQKLNGDLIRKKMYGLVDLSKKKFVRKKASYVTTKIDRIFIFR